MVRAIDLKRVGLNKENSRKKRCGCIQKKSTLLGSDIWINDADLMCEKHQKQHYRELEDRRQKSVIVK